MIDQIKLDYPVLTVLDEGFIWEYLETLDFDEDGQASDIVTLKEALSVIAYDIEYSLITSNYFSQLSNQPPWDLDTNTRNVLMGSPACAPSQYVHKASTLTR